MNALVQRRMFPPPAMLHKRSTRGTVVLEAHHDLHYVLLCEGEQSCATWRRRVSEMDSTNFAVLLQRAAAIVGGPDLLCARLRVAPDLLHRWLTGQRKAPAAIFLQAADIISAYADKNIAAQARHEGVIAQSLAVTSENALVRLMSREARQENRII